MLLYVWHHEPCGGVFWYTRRHLQPGDAVCCDDIIKADGSIPQADDPILCGTCGGHSGPPGGLAWDWVEQDDDATEVQI